MTSDLAADDRKLVRSRTPRDGRRRPYLSRIVFTLVLFAVVLVLAGLWVASRALVVKESLEATNTSLAAFETEALDGNSSISVESLAKLQASSSAAKEAVSDPLWKIAGMLPWVGANFSAVSEVAVSVDDIVDRALVPLLSDTGVSNFKQLTPVNGAVNIDWLQAGEPKLTAAANVVHLSHDRLAGIDSSGLIQEIAVPLTSATSKLKELDVTLQAAARTAQILPKMLGADEPRRYLLLVQNNAEARATGGIPGALAVLTADKGRLTLDDQTSASALRAFTPPVTVDSDQEAIYSRRLGTFMQDVNLTPDFPITGATARAMWQRNSEQHVHGVISIDPVALSYLLDATGPVRLSQSELMALATKGMPTELTAENVVKTLLSDIYANVEEPRLQDAYFAGVAQEIFTALSTGKGKAENLIEGLTRAAGDGRILIWSGRPEEQSVIANYPLSGSVTGPSVAPAQFGVYFNDGTGAKMDYYVKRTVQLVKECGKDGYEQTTVRITSTNTAPADAATSLPAYVTGDGNFGVPAGSVQTNIVAYGPVQANVEIAKLDGERTDFAPHVHSNRPVGVVAVRLAPGESRTVEFTFGRIVQHTEPNVVVTPTVQDVKDVTLPTENAVCER